MYNTAISDVNTTATAEQFPIESHPKDCQQADQTRSDMLYQHMHVQVLLVGGQWLSSMGSCRLTYKQLSISLDEEDGSGTQQDTYTDGAYCVKDAVPSHP